MFDTMKYSCPLHFHEFVMELNKHKWDGSSAECGLWGVCCRKGQTYVGRAPNEKVLLVNTAHSFPARLLFH